MRNFITIALLLFALYSQAQETAVITVFAGYVTENYSSKVDTTILYVSKSKVCLWNQRANFCSDIQRIDQSEAFLDWNDDGVIDRVLDMNVVSDNATIHLFHVNGTLDMAKIEEANIYLTLPKSQRTGRYYVSPRMEITCFETYTVAK